MTLWVVFESAELLEGRTHSIRPYGLTKPQVSRAAFASLWRTLHNGPSSQVAWRLVCSDNGSTQEYRDWVHAHAWAHLAPDGVPVYPVGPEGRSTAAMAARLAELGAADHDWLLIAEDDQLWAGDAIWVLHDFLTSYQGDFVLVPYIQPYMNWELTAEHQSFGQLALQHDGDALKLKDIGQALGRPRAWVRSRNHHWMQTFWTNGTMLLRVGLLRQWYREWPAGMSGHDFLAGKAESVPFLSPVPPVSTHFQEGCESPGFNQRLTEEWVRGLLV